MCPELGSAPVTGKAAGLAEQPVGMVTKGSFSLWNVMAKLLHLLEEPLSRMSS